MKIKKVIASEFGCLSGSYSLRDDRANVIVEENEAGKSTLVAAIVTGLYGLTREKGKLSDRETYKPWKGGSYRVGLELEDDQGRPLLIDREFPEKKEKVRVTDLSTNKDITKEFRAGKNDFAIGERLLGLSREVFVKTCLVRQLEIENVGDSSELVAKVQQIFDTSGGKGTAAAAIRLLENAIRKYPGTKLKQPGLVETEISRLNDAIGTCEIRMNELAAQREKAAPEMIRLRELRKKLQDSEALRRNLEYLTRKAEMAESEVALKDQTKTRSELDKLIERKKSLEPYRDFTKEKASAFARVAGRLEGLLKEKGEREQSLAQLKKELEQTARKLKEHEKLGDLGEEFKTRLHDLWIELARLGEEAEKASKRLAKFEKSLGDEGYDLSEIDGLSAKFSLLSVEDKDLLRDSESAIPRMEVRLREFGADEQRCRNELRALRKPTRALLPVGAILSLAGILTILLRALGIGVAVTAVGAVTLILAIIVLPRRNRQRIERLLGEQAKVAEEQQSLLKERDELKEKIEEMAKTAGSETVAQLAEAFKRWGRLQDRALRLESLRKEVGWAQESLRSGREKASGELKTMGLDVAPEQVDLTTMQKAEKTLREYLDLKRSLRETEQRRKEIEAEIRKLDQERATLQELIRSSLKAANLPENLPLEEALPKVEEVRQKSEEYQQIGKVWIPDKQEKLLTQEKVEEMRARLQTLRREIETMVAEQPELAGLSVTKMHSEYEEQAREVAREVTQMTDEKNRLFKTVQDIEDRYREEYPRLANERAELKQNLDRAERFQQSVTLAIETLQAISARSHALWARELNPRTNEILRHVNPRARELKFDRDLSFTIVPEQGALPMDTKHIQAQQSVGARHQVYLAVRLALTDYLSSGGNKLPVILDDPFATSDDERFLSGMKLLCRDFRKEHQVIILTCHRQRHSNLIREKAPDLLKEMHLLTIAPQ